MRLEETPEYRSYLCLAKVCGTLRSDNMGSDGDYDDSGYFEEHITELFGADIDRVFDAQHVQGVFGSQRWAFTDPANDYSGDDLHARLFQDRDNDVYYLVNRPTVTFDDKITGIMTAVGAGVPDQFKQVAQLMELVKPEFRDKIVLTGLSLGGALSAYAAIKAPWPVRTIVFDPLGLNRSMMGGRGVGLFPPIEVMSDRFRSLDDVVDWFYIAGSWVAKLNVDRHLSSVGRVTEIPQDPVRATNNPDTHDFRHVRFGLHRLWEDTGWRGSRAPASEPAVHVEESSESWTPPALDFGAEPTSILVSEDVLQAASSSGTSIWAALESAAVPIAVEYLPASESEMTKYRSVPVNATAQAALVNLVEAVNPSGPTLFRVVLPQGAELARAIGGGFRGFAAGPGGRISAQAVLKPVGVSGALVAGWPLLAVTGTVMALDMLAQREQRAHQRKVEAILGRMEERAYIERIMDQRTADAQLTRAISLILDGQNPPLETALKSAYDEFHRAQVWLEKYDRVVARLIGQDGKINYKQLQSEIGGDLNYFFLQLQMAEVALTIRQKALIADAAAQALADPANPYKAFRRFLESQSCQLKDAEGKASGLLDSLSTIRIRGGWPDSPAKVQAQERGIQEMASRPAIDTNTTVQFLRKESGEFVQILLRADNEK